MPKLYDCLLLAKSLREPVELPNYFSLYTDSSGLDSAQGYYGKVYIDREHQEILFVHRSTTIDNKIQPHENSSFVAAANLVSDSAIYLNVLPQASQVALKFVKKQLSILSRAHVGYASIQIGHSLGGFHAHICGYTLKHRVIAIDPPGCAEILIKLKTPFDHQQCEQHHSLFVRRNQINETNSHVGKLAYHQFEEHWGKSSSLQTTSNTLSTHSLDYFMAHIPRDSLDSIAALPQNFFWLNSPSLVTSSSSFYRSTFESSAIHIQFDDSDILGDQEEIRADRWIVFILNEKERGDHQNCQHAFLLLEGIRDGVHILARYELVTSDNVHAKIILRENYHDVLGELETSGNRRRWQYKYTVINQVSAELLVQHIYNDYHRGENQELFF
ncbi:MAG: hypothetical protein LRY43_01485 [Gammaproteobacteria bacterium]|nr:hypothetical protein [Gammaproteobacteria bacterium]